MNPCLEKIEKATKKRLGFKTPNQVFFRESYNVAFTT
jgi:hypothetical protein|tara:strand:+ start:108 stop:218 length:111 start_codon:yes stop_codon:yes gene_type:complete